MSAIARTLPPLSVEAGGGPGVPAHLGGFPVAGADVQRGTVLLLGGQEYGSEARLRVEGRKVGGSEWIKRWQALQKLCQQREAHARAVGRADHHSIAVYE